MFNHIKDLRQLDGFAQELVKSGIQAFLALTLQSMSPYCHYGVFKATSAQPAIWPDISTFLSRFTNFWKP